MPRSVISSRPRISAVSDSCSPASSCARSARTVGVAWLAGRLWRSRARFCASAAIRAPAECRLELGGVGGAGEDEALELGRRRIVGVRRAKAVEAVAAEDHALGDRGGGFGRVDVAGLERAEIPGDRWWRRAGRPLRDQARPPRAGARRSARRRLPRPTIASRVPPSGKATPSFLNAGLRIAGAGRLRRARPGARRPRRGWSRGGRRRAPRTPWLRVPRPPSRPSLGRACGATLTAPQYDCALSSSASKGISIWQRP